MSNTLIVTGEKSVMLLHYIVRRLNIMVGKRKYPLRKIIERDVLISGGIKNSNGFIEPRVFGNKLECGHIVRPSTDFYGEVHADHKQRCRQCYEINLINSQ